MNKGSHFFFLLTMLVLTSNSQARAAEYKPLNQLFEEISGNKHSDSTSLEEYLSDLSANVIGDKTPAEVFMRSGRMQRAFELLIASSTRYTDEKTFAELLMSGLLAERYEALIACCDGWLANNKLANPTSEAVVLDFCGTSYYRLNNRTAAMRCFERAKRIRSKSLINDKSARSTSTSEIGLALARTDKVGCALIRSTGVTIIEPDNLDDPEANQVFQRIKQLENAGQFEAGTLLAEEASRKKTSEDFFTHYLALCKLSAAVTETTDRSKLLSESRRLSGTCRNPSLSVQNNMAGIDHISGNIEGKAVLNTLLKRKDLSTARRVQMEQAHHTFDLLESSKVVP